MSWRGFGHREIYEMVVNAGEGPAVSADAEIQWSRMNETVLEAERGIAAAVHATESEWQGAGADAMRTAYTPLGAYAVTAAVAAAKTARGVSDQAVQAASTRMYVADNAPPQNLLEHLHSELGSWDGHTIYDEQAAAVDRLMVTYENLSQENEARFDHWGVPPTVVVTPAAAAPPPGGPGVGALPDTGGVAPAGGGGSGIAAALSPGAAGGGSVPSGVGSVGGAPSPGGGPASGGATGPAGIGGGPVPGVGGSPAGVPAGAGRSTTPGGATPGSGGPGAGGPGAGGLGGGPGAVGSGAGGSGAGRTPRAGAVPGGAAGGAGPSTGGVARPSDRPLGSPGGSGTGRGPWSRAAADAGRPPAATPFRPAVPGAPPRPSTPDWRSVLLPPEREPAAPTRAPGEPAARSANPAGPGGGATTTQAAGSPAAATRGAGTPGMHAPMMGGGVGGAQGEGRRRASYLIDDSDAFVDKRWFTEPVITPDDPL